MAPSILVTRRLPARVESLLRDRYSATLRIDDEPLSSAELSRALGSHEIVLCTLGDRFTATMLGASGVRTRLLANFGVGVDHIDVGAAAQAGMAVTNTPGVLTEDTADLAMLLILASARRVGEGLSDLKAGTWYGWRPTYLLGTRVSGKSLGIVGFGRIGRALARRASAGFSMSVRYYSRSGASADVERETGAVRVSSLEELASEVDFLSLHCPATPATRHLIDDRILGLMKPDAFLINTARGDIVDENALIARLRNRSIAGAGLDVFEREPAVPGELLSLPNVVALPHIGSATIESRTAMGMKAVANIAAWIAGDPPPDLVVSPAGR
ncbi:MAG: 2-hydroxyacid dehydrogenase [Gemmatimonadota bacterium]